jgi:hypothetical protein
MQMRGSARNQEPSASTGGTFTTTTTTTTTGKQGSELRSLAPATTAEQHTRQQQQ